MRLIFFTDGSDDGFAAAQLVAALIDPAAVSYIAVVAVTWPQRPSPIWEKANEAHLALMTSIAPWRSSRISVSNGYAQS
jgi:hypothetical protein